MLEMQFRQMKNDEFFIIAALEASGLIISDHMVYRPLAEFWRLLQTEHENEEFDV